MSTFTNTAREVEMPNGDVVVIHNAPTGGENTTSNIKKFKYDDNGHVTESTAADAEDLNLSSYSTPTTGTTAIGASDDVQTAIGKLDHQSHIDQTNISSVLDKTGKNFLDCSLDRLKAVNNEGTWNGNVYTVASVGTVTINSNNTITVVKTGTSARLVFYLSSNQEAAAISGDKFAGYILSGCPSGGSSTTYRLTGEEISSPWSTVANDYGSGDTIQSSTLQVGFYISIHADYTTTGSGLTFSPMICTETDWKVSQNYSQFALPNTDLTRLESEDRAVLVEQVDTGNKNLIRVDLDYIVSANNTLTWNENVGTTSDGHTTFTVNQTDGTIRVQSDGSNAQSQFVIIGESISPYFTIDERYVISGCPSGGSTTKYDLRAWFNNVYYMDFGDSSAFTCSLTRLKVDIVIRANQTLDLTFKPMICKEIDWNVSNKLVPGELTGGLKPVYRYNSGTGSKAVSYTIKRDDFITDGICTTSCGTYIVSVVNWSSTPLFSLYAISFSGGNTSYVNVSKIAGTDLTITVTESTFSFSTTGTVRIYALV